MHPYTHVHTDLACRGKPSYISRFHHPVPLMTVQDAMAGLGPVGKCFILLQKHEDAPGSAGVWLAGIALKWCSEKMAWHSVQVTNKRLTVTVKLIKTVKTKQFKEAHEIGIQGCKSHLYIFLILSLL